MAKTPALYWRISNETLVLDLDHFFAITACTPSLPLPTPEPQESAIPIIIYITATPPPTLTPTVTPTPAPTDTPAPTRTTTPEVAGPIVTVNKQAHCRYGPSAAYLHAADLYAGDKGVARYRGMYSNWLYVQFEKLSYSCWVAPSVVDVVGDVSTLQKFEPDLQRIGSNMYGPPQNVQATRNDDQVTITWNQVNMTADDDRGYLIEAFVCQDGAYLWWTFSYPDQYTTSYTVKDEPGCAAPSWGRIFTVEKHGFSQPAEIPWPAP
ncbi:MAG: fibronectin type III domain-containing protein [Chloroflexi bacterium]|nr:fibronectin type III domain-containing protein [Chloroflexota bacterium]